ncbi:hypothetical protein IJH02_00760 [Candidatus Saccharibacteria bacterium]|nr:hypothetical protein [Candidatus Saccharibacteria bacterium]
MVEQLSIKRKRNIKTIFLVIGLVVLCAGAGVALALLTHKKADTSSNDEIKTTVSEPSKTTVKETEKDTETDNFNEVPQYEGENPNELHELTGIITYTGKTSENLSIRVSIDQILGSGTCNLTMTSGSATYAAAAPIIQSGATTSSCEGFDVPLSELSAGKTWNINIKLTSEEKTGVISGEVSL